LSLRHTLKTQSESPHYTPIFSATVRAKTTFLNAQAEALARSLTNMSQRLRKLGLSLHVILSVGWLGAVIAFLALGLASFSRDPSLTKAAYLTMAVVGRSALIPLSVGALVSGIVQSLGTKWGLFRHHWVLVKLVLTVFATAALFVHQATAISDAARLAADATTLALQSGRLHELGVQLLTDAGIATVLLSTVTLIAIYKPWGAVGYVTRSLKVFLAAVTAFIIAFVALHLSGHSPHQHNH